MYNRFRELKTTAPGRHRSSQTPYPIRKEDAPMLRPYLRSSRQELDGIPCLLLVSDWACSD